MTKPAKAFVALSIFSAYLFSIPYPAQSPAPQPADAALRQQGKQIFTEKCGKCHDTDARKKLPDGTTLLARLAANKDPRARIATRLKSMSEQDGHAVVVYMEDLIAAFRATQKISTGDH